MCYQSISFGFIQEIMLIYKTDKFGHYHDYETLFAKLFNAKIVSPGINQVLRIFSPEPILFSDGDNSHIKFLPLIAIRGVLGRVSIFSMVRSEIMLSSKIQHQIKNSILQFWREYFRFKIISNHYGRPEPQIYSSNDFVVWEPQMWDVPFLSDGREPNPSVKDLIADCGGRYLLIAGRMNSKRCSSELTEWLKYGNCGLIAIVAGCGVEYEEIFARMENVKVVRGFVENIDLWYLISNARAINCFYDSSVARPSGIFGRAVQFKKPVIIRKGGFLDSVYKYERAIPVTAMPKSIQEMDLETVESIKISKDYDHSDHLRLAVQKSTC
jgi:hypothetical protein